MTRTQIRAKLTNIEYLVSRALVAKTKYEVSCYIADIELAVMEIADAILDRKV